MKVSDVIRNASDEDMARIIGGVAVKLAYDISVEQAIEIEFKKTLEVLQTEVDNLD